MPPGGTHVYNGRYCWGMGPASKKAPCTSPSCNCHLCEDIIWNSTVRPIWEKVGLCNIPCDAFCDRSGSKWPCRQKRALTFQCSALLGSGMIPFSITSSMAFLTITKRLPMMRCFWCFKIQSALCFGTRRTACLVNESVPLLHLSRIHLCLQPGFISAMGNLLLSSFLHELCYQGLMITIFHEILP